MILVFIYVLRNRQNVTKGQVQTFFPVLELVALISQKKSVYPTIYNNESGEEMDSYISEGQMKRKMKRKHPHPEFERFFTTITITPRAPLH